MSGFAEFCPVKDEPGAQGTAKSDDFPIDAISYYASRQAQMPLQHTTRPCYGLGPVIVIRPSITTMRFGPMSVSDSALSRCAHLFVRYFGMVSMITPPVAIASYVAASLAEANPVETAFEAMRIGRVAYLVHFLVAFSPALLLRGSVLESLLAFVTALVGSVLVSAALIGYLSGPLNAAMGLLSAAFGVSLFVPADAFAGTWLTNVAGLIGLVLIMLFTRSSPGGAGAT